MDEAARAEALFREFRVARGDYAAAERQLLAFADLWLRLDPAQAAALRGRVDPKARLGRLVAACSVLRHEFAGAEGARQAALARMLFALVSCDDLDFGYDTLLQVDGVLPLFAGHGDMARQAWAAAAPLSANPLTQQNIAARLAVAQPVAEGSRP